MSKTVSQEVHICLVCGWMYSEQDGDPGTGIAPGTAWSEVPDSWACPECGVPKTDFTPIEL